MSEHEPAAVEPAPAETAEYLIGVRLREPLLADDYLTTDIELHVGDLVLVETGSGTVVGEVRRPRRPLPEFKRDRALPAGAARGHPGRGRRVARPRDREQRARGDVPADGAGRGPRHEDRRRGDRAAAPACHRVLQLGGPRRLPRPRARPGPRVPRPDRDAADRRPRHHQADRRHRPVRPPALLLVAPAQVRADLGEDGQGAGHAAHRQPAARQLRAPQVLPALRVLDLRGAALAAAAGEHAVLRVVRRRRLHDRARCGPCGCSSSRWWSASRTAPRPRCRSTSSPGKGATTSSRA